VFIIYNVVIELLIVMNGITESSTDPPAVPPANLVSDAFGKRRRPVGRCGGGSITAGTTGCGWVG